MDSRLRCRKQNYKNVGKPYRNNSITSGQEHFLRQKSEQYKGNKHNAVYYMLCSPRDTKWGVKEKPESEKLYPFLKNL